MMEIMQKNKKNPIPQPALKQGSATWEGVLTAHGTLAGEGVVSVAVNAHTNKRGWSSLRGGTTLPSAVSKACGCDGAKGTTSADASASEAQAFSLLGFSVFFALHL
jgi:hypothetical protein